MKRALAVFGLLLWVCVHAQAQSSSTTPINDTVSLGTQSKDGVNIGLPSYYDNGIVYDNMDCLQNCGVEPSSHGEVLQQYVTGDTSDLIATPFYTSGGTVLAANFYNGYYLEITESTTSNKGCIAKATASAPYVGISAALLAFSSSAVASNVVTIVTTSASTYASGMKLLLSGSSKTYLNGVLFTVGSVSGTTVTLSASGFTHADVASSSDAGTAEDEMAITPGSIVCGADRRLATVTNGSSTITVYPNVTGLSSAELVTMDGVPNGTTLTAVNASTGTATLSAAATANNTLGFAAFGGTASSTLPAVTISGDQFIAYKDGGPTSESDWEGGKNQFSSTLTCGSTLTSDMANAIEGTQSLLVTNGCDGGAKLTFPFDNTPQDVYKLVDGAHAVGARMQLVSGTQTVAVNVMRGGTVLCSGTFTPTSSVVDYQLPTCSPTEKTTFPSPQILTVNYTFNGVGVTRVDKFVFQDISAPDPTNTSHLRKEVIAALRYANGTYNNGIMGSYRVWTRNAGSRLKRDLSTASLTEINTFGTPKNTSWFPSPSLVESLNVGDSVGSTLHWTIPCGYTDTEVAGTIEYLSNPDTTKGYGALRAAAGHPAPWVAATGARFTSISLAGCNESWNPEFPGENIPPGRPGADRYADYSLRMGSFWHAARAATGFAEGVHHLVMNSQYGSPGEYTYTGSGNDMSLMLAKGNSGNTHFEVSPYWCNYVAEPSSEQNLWAGCIEQAWAYFNNTSDVSQVASGVQAYEGLSRCVDGTQQCGAQIYEWNDACGQTGTGAAAIDQTNLTRSCRGMGQFIIALSMLMNARAAGITETNLFGLTQFGASASIGYESIFAAMGDAGGAMSKNNAAQFGGLFSPFPALMAVHMMNQGNIGPKIQCSNNTAGYSWSGSTNGPTSSVSGTVPYVFVRCNKDTGTNRTVLILNTDQVNYNDMSFTGSGAPQGLVTVEEVAPTSLNDIFEAVGGADSHAVTAPTEVNRTTLMLSSTYRVKAHSAVLLTYSTTVPQLQNRWTYGSSVTSGGVIKY